MDGVNNCPTGYVPIFAPKCTQGEETGWQDVCAQDCVYNLPLDISKIEGETKRPNKKKFPGCLTYDPRSFAPFEVDEECMCPIGYEMETKIPKVS